MSTNKNKNLHTAKKEKNDEFYTEISDIEKELRHYKDSLKGKVVYCNCDDYRWSKFVEYFKTNFSKIGLKKLIATNYDIGNGAWKYTYDGISETIEQLKGDGDFRSEECIKILETCDVVVTNCPFSLFREYVAQLMKYKKKFLIIGNMNAITYKEIFPYIKNNELWFGYKNFGGGMNMIQPKSTFDKTKTKSFSINSNGDIIKNIMGVIWFTNIPHNKRNQPLDLYKKYNPTDYKIYDNYCAVNVDRVDEIPCDEYIDIEIDDADYDKWKAAYGDDVEIIKEGENNKKKIRIHKPVYGVPITFLSKYCPDQFEIVAFRKGEDGKDLIFFFGRRKEDSTLLSYPYSTAIPGMIKNAEGKVNGKITYARITIRMI